MAERKFDYQAISEIYKKMQNITGDKSDPSSIAGILNQIDEDVHDKVGEVEQAVYGDLGKQLLLDWENTSASFPNFVSNFENWAALIAKSAGSYQEFEQKVNGLKTSNPLGMSAIDASGNSMTTNYIDSSYYRQYSNDNIDKFKIDYGNLNELYNITGVDYVVTDSESILRTHKIVSGLMLVGDIASLAIVAWTSLPTATTGSTGSVPTVPALEASNTPLALNGTVAQPIGEGIERIVLTDVGNSAGNQALLSSFYNAQEAGATLFQESSPGVIEFLNNAGTVIATLTKDGFKFVL